MIVTSEQRRIYWLSGSPCAGKTTISNLLAERNGWNVYHCDDRWADHRERATLDRHPHWHAYSRLRGDALWLQPPDEHEALAERAYDEELTLILEDLDGLLRADGRDLIFDGYIAPKHLKPLLPSPNRAFYLISAEPFQLRYYAERPWIKDVLAPTSDPERAWANWMKRDLISARRLEREAAENTMSWLLVDGSLTIEATAARIESQFLGRD